MARIFALRVPRDGDAFTEPRSTRQNRVAFPEILRVNFTAVHGGRLSADRDAERKERWPACLGTITEGAGEEQMAGSVNKVILVGNLGRDPEVRFLQDGTKVAHLSVATSERWKDRQSGEQREKTEWHRVVIFNDRLADVAEKYLRKGAKVYVEGALQTRKWAGNDGQERYTTEVVLQRFRGELTMLDGRSEGGTFDSGDPGYGMSEPQGSAPGGASGKAPGGGSGGGQRGPDLDDEIPF